MTTTITAPAAVRVGTWKRLKSRRGLWFTIADFTLIIAIWHIAVVNLELVSRVFLPAPADVIVGYGELAEAGVLWNNMGHSALTWVIGYGLGFVVGVVVGLLVGSLHVAYKLGMPLLWAAWATPLVAIQPIIGVWFGFGIAPNIVLVFLSAAIYDKSALKEIEKAIVNFPNLGASPNNDGEIIRVTMPELTEDRRKEYVKIVKQKAEDCKVAIRNIRRRAKDDLDALKSEVGDDEVARGEKELEAITKRATDAADEALKKKEAELLEV